MQTPKIILDQIDRAANQNRKLGSVKTTSPITLSYRDLEDAVVEGIKINVDWKKRYYNYDRGTYFPLDVYSFTNFSGKIYRTEVKGQEGNFINYLEDAYANAHYSTKVYVNTDVSINLKITLTNGSLSVYINQIETFRSGTDSSFMTSTQSFFLKKGWNTLDLFIYHYGANGIFSISGDLGSKIASYESPDFTPPDAPTWTSDSPTTVRYVDIEKSQQLVADFKWVNPKYNTAFQQVKGWGLYRKDPEYPKDSAGNYIIVVSGWGNTIGSAGPVGTYIYNSIAVSGDKRSYFQYNNKVWCRKSDSFAYNSCYLSGTSYKSDIDQTIIHAINPPSFPLGFYNDFWCGVGSRVGTDIYTHIKDFENDSTSTYFISGTDTSALEGTYHDYYLNAYDDSININRSEFSIKKTINWRVPTAPYITSAKITNTTGGFKKIITWVYNPQTWNESNALAIKGFRIWDVTSPRSNLPLTDHLIADIPVAVSGTATCITVDRRLSGGLYTDLLDNTSYTFYISSYDWYGYEVLNSLPGFTATTIVSIKTGQSSNRVELDGTTGTLKIYADI